jgi:3-hydroxyisobutyrate dehydrogenase
MEAAQSVDAYTPMGSEAETLYARFAEALGGGNKDFSAIIRMIDDSWVAPEGTEAPPPPLGAKL